MAPREGWGIMSLCQRGLLTSWCPVVLVHSLDLYMHFGALDLQPLYPTNLVVCVIFLVEGWEQKLLHLGFIVFYDSIYNKI